MNTNNFLWNQQLARFRLATSNSGTSYNWLFFPGGPGADSSYLSSLIEVLKVPGNCWLVDLPANGTNLEFGLKADYDFEQWYDFFIPLIQQFQNPMIVGHSFGGMFPLLFPELENNLKGFVILNSAPSLWLETADKIAKEKKLPDLTKPMAEFTVDPNPATFKTALLACAPYYFPPQTLAQGTKLLEKLPFNFHAAVWWLRKAHEINFNAKWIPQKIPTLIIGSSEDCITPSDLFENDQRFKRSNIQYQKINQAGHMPWLEQPDIVAAAFRAFINKINNSL